MRAGRRRAGRARRRRRGRRSRRGDRGRARRAPGATWTNGARTSSTVRRRQRITSSSVTRARSARAETPGARRAGGRAPPAAVHAEVDVRDHVAIGRDEQVLAARLDGETTRAPASAATVEAALVGGDQRLPTRSGPQRGGVPVDRCRLPASVGLDDEAAGLDAQAGRLERSACSERSAGTPFTCAMRSSRWRRRPARWRRPSTPRSRRRRRRRRKSRPACRRRARGRRPARPATRTTRAAGDAARRPPPSPASGQGRTAPYGWAGSTAASDRAPRAPRRGRRAAGRRRRRARTARR